MTSKTAFLILKATDAPCPIMGRALLWLWGLFLKYYNIMKRNKQFLQELSLFLEQNFHLPITAKDAANAFQLVLLFYSLFVSRFPLRKSGCFLK